MRYEDYSQWIRRLLPSGMSHHTVWSIHTKVSEQQWQLSPRLHSVTSHKTVLQHKWSFLNQFNKTNLKMFHFYSSFCSCMSFQLVQGADRNQLILFGDFLHKQDSHKHLLLFQVQDLVLCYWSTTTLWSFGLWHHRVWWGGTHVLEECNFPIHFGPEDGDRTFLWSNNTNPPDCMMPYTKRSQCKYSTPWTHYNPILTAPPAPSCVTFGSPVQVTAAVHLLRSHHQELGNESLGCLLHSQCHWIHITGK